MKNFFLLKNEMTLIHVTHALPRVVSIDYAQTKALAHGSRSKTLVGAIDQLPTVLLQKKRTLGEGPVFHSEPPRAHPVVEPHACSHDIVELTNDRDWYTKTGEYYPEEGSVNGVVRFGKIGK